MIKCDRCGREMNDDWTARDGSGMAYGGGNCPACGDNLCSSCAGEWRDINGDGVCEKCWTTPKGRKDDTGKLRFDLVPWLPFEEVVKVLGYGADRYGDNNWKEVKPFTDRYSAALMRHYSKWAQGERLDPESGLPHLAHLICDGLFLLYKETQQHGNKDDSGTN